MDALFFDDEKKEYREEDVYQALKAVGADDCETLFLHSDLTFGTIPLDFNRKEYLRAFSNALDCLGVKNLIVPTFTYSFCNGEIYDVKKSRTPMGSLNEYLRKQPGRYRTMDPLLSLSVPQNLEILYSDISQHSLGKGSGLDILHSMRNVKILFLGARLHDCFTYLHYVEKMMDVPYRFDMPFTGEVVDEFGQHHKRTQYMHTACTGVTLREGTYLEDYLVECGLLRRVRLGNGFVSCIDEAEAYRELWNIIERNPCYFLTAPYCVEELRHEYTYDASAGRITHC